MTKKLELGRGWFDRKTNEEAEVLISSWKIWNKKKSYYVIYRYLSEPKNITHNVPRDFFLQLFRRKEDENSRD
jgi:hypothetical protein